MVRFLSIGFFLAFILSSTTALAEASIQDFCADLTETECEEDGCEWVNGLCQSTTTAVDAGTPADGTSDASSEMPSTAESDSSGCSMGNAQQRVLIPLLLLVGLWGFGQRR